MDYPDTETAYKRFKRQGVLTNEEIYEAINNTNVFLEVEEYDCECFTKNIKMPTLYPNLSQKERDLKFIHLVNECWQEEKTRIPEDEWPHYIKEIRNEIDTVVSTKHSDYFLLDYELVKRGVKKGGVITPTGRGSGPSFIINKLLGFTKIDRIASPVKMYPERFMSKTRINETKSLADLDLNLANPEVFAEAQEELFGEVDKKLNINVEEVLDYDKDNYYKYTKFNSDEINLMDDISKDNEDKIGILESKSLDFLSEKMASKSHSAPMIAYGTMQPRNAFKMQARANKIDVELQNIVTSQIGMYENDMKHFDKDSGDEEPNVLDYIDEQYHDVFLKSEKYLGMISDGKQHPCAYLVYQGDIPSEIGLVVLKNTVCTVLDGGWAEEYKFLKND